MDSFEWNKIAGWLLAAAATVLALIIVTDEIYKPERLTKPSYIVEGVEVESAAAGPAAVEQPIEAFLASASAEKGAAVFKKCAACHSIEKGGANGIGPNLYGIVGANHARAAGFSYSDALAGTKSEPWNWANLNKWLTSPKGYLPGNKMAFAGLGKPEDRAAVLAYLNSKSDSPLPMPAAPAEAPATADATTAAPATTDAAPAAGKAPDVPVADEKTAAAAPEKVGGPASPAAGTTK